jgi:hypothetical protein
VLRGYVSVSQKANEMSAFASPVRYKFVIQVLVYCRDPVLMDVKLAQARYLAERTLIFQMRIKEEVQIDPLLFVVGDFNSLPGDAVRHSVS